MNAVTTKIARQKEVIVTRETKTALNVPRIMIVTNRGHTVGRTIVSNASIVVIAPMKNRYAVVVVRGEEDFAEQSVRISAIVKTGEIQARLVRLENVFPARRKGIVHHLSVAFTGGAYHDHDDVDANCKGTLTFTKLVDGIKGRRHTGPLWRRDTGQGDGRLRAGILLQEAGG